MKECSKTLYFQLECNCCQEEPPKAGEPTESPPLQDIYAKFGQILETELRTQHEKYSTDID